MGKHERVCEMIYQQAFSNIRIYLIEICEMWLLVSAKLTGKEKHILYIIVANLTFIDLSNCQKYFYVVC